MNGGRTLLLALLFGTVAPDVQGSPAAVAGTNVESPEMVVQSFYKDTTANEKQLSKWFEPTLAKLLAADRHRQAKAKEICGFLDFDPFTAAQDDVGTAKVGKVSISGIQARVDVSFSAAPDSKVVVMLQRSKTGWRIKNIIYPGEKEQSLIDLLQAAAKEKCD